MTRLLKEKQILDPRFPSTLVNQQSGQCATSRRPRTIESTMTLTAPAVRQQAAHRRRGAADGGAH
jgi:hypothetical protein